MTRWLALSAVVALGCGGSKSGDAETENAAEVPAGEAIEQTTEDGPVRAVVSVTPKAPKLGDPLTLVLEVTAKPGVRLEMPDFGEALGRFTIIDFTPRERTEADGSVVSIQRYTLQTPMSGRQRIPPLRIEYTDGRSASSADAGVAGPRELLTEALSVQVESVLPEGTVAGELKPARDELAPHKQATDLLIVLLAIGGALVVAGGVIFYFVWMGRARERARRSAYDVAAARLGELKGRGLPGPDEADAWYVELSSIIRHYLEDRYGVRAPELTTEEFLREAGRSVDLSADNSELLSEFLEGCDRVKFAAYHPDETESGQAIEAAMRFLEQTRLVQETEPAQLAVAA